MTYNDTSRKKLVVLVLFGDLVLLLLLLYMMLTNLGWTAKELPTLKQIRRLLVLYLDDFDGGTISQMIAYYRQG